MITSHVGAVAIAARPTRLAMLREKQSFHKIVFSMMKKLANTC